MNEVDYGKYTVLVVDDNPTNLGVIGDYLQELGFRILIATDGELAIKRAAYALPDIILLDIMMPGIDGFETCKRLKASSTTKDIPVIFMTALGGTEDKVRGFSIGAVDYVTKPIQQDEVLARMTTHLRIRDLTRAMLQTNATLTRRATQLEINSQVGQHITSILDLDELLDQVVNLIEAYFRYYAVSVWLVTDQKDAIALKATSSVGKGLELRIPMNSRGIIVEVCQTGKPYIANNVHEDPLYSPLAAWPNVQAELALPLHVGERVIGALDVASEQSEAFTMEDRVALQTLADQIAVAIRNAQLYHAEKERRMLAESLEQTGRVLSSSLDMTEVPGRILASLVTVVPYERGSILLQQDDVLAFAARYGFPPDYQATDVQVHLREGDVFYQLATTRRPVILEDVTSNPSWQQMEGLPLNRSWLGVPLIAKDKVIGMMSLTRPEANAFAKDEVTLVLAFAGQAAIALENASLYEQITHFNQQLEDMVNQRTKEVEGAYETLEKIDRTKSDFINIVAHELRTPLTVIKGYAQILEASAKDAQSKSLVEGILSGHNRMHEIINSMLDVSKIDSQALEVRHEVTSLVNILKGVKSAFETAVIERKINITLVGLSDLPTVHGDPDLLQKLFYQLVVNAIKYTPDGGTITVSGRTTTLNDQPAVEIMVQDTGLGIDPAYHELIFEKFFQMGAVATHSSGKTKFKGGGPGLGLAIAKGIVQAHHGRIWVESEGTAPDQFLGSRFYVQLPL